MNSTTEIAVQIAIFAKAPIPGHTKTRLIPRLGAEGAARLQQALLNYTIEKAVAADLGPVSLWCAPSSDHRAFHACRDAWNLPLFDQRGEDLGARMHHALSRLCSRAPTLLIGTDSPALTVADLRAAAQALTGGEDAVVLPAEDGGYVLIGLHRVEPGLFDATPWGSSGVMAVTRQRLSQRGWRWAEPRLLWDVDRPEDLDRLMRSGLFDEFSEVISP